MRFSQRNIIIAALSLSIGLGFTQVPEIFSIFPQIIQNVFAETALRLCSWFRLFEFGAAEKIWRLINHKKTADYPKIVCCFLRLKFSVLRDTAEFFFYSQKLIIFCNSVCSARCTCFYLSCVYSNGNIGDCCIFRFTAAV